MQPTRQIYSAISTYIHIAEYVGREGWWLDSKSKNWWNRKERFRHNAVYLVTKGAFDLTVGTVRYRVTQGDMVFIPADSELSFFFDGRGPLEKYYVHFDLTLGAGGLADHFRLPHVFKPQDASRVEAIFLQLCECCAGGQPTAQLAANGLLLSLVAEMLDAAGAKFVETPHGLDRETELALDYIDRHIGKSLSVEAIARRVGYSVPYFTKKFKKALGVTPTVYIANLRLDMAKRYLAAGDMSVQEIAEALGFCDASYFSHFFKEKTGLYPAYYRKHGK